MEGTYKHKETSEQYRFITIDGVAMGWRKGSTGMHPCISFPLGHAWQSEFEPNPVNGRE